MRNPRQLPEELLGLASTGKDGDNSPLEAESAIVLVPVENCFPFCVQRVGRHVGDNLLLLAVLELVEPRKALDEFSGFQSVACVGVAAVLEERLYSCLLLVVQQR